MHIGLWKVWVLDAMPSMILFSSVRLSCPGVAVLKDVCKIRSTKPFGVGRLPVYLVSCFLVIFFFH